MSHQPFENWILGEEGLQEDQRQALAGHLAECAECARLSRSLAAVERTLTQSEVAAPAPGFGARFALRLEGRRVRAGRQQAWLAFGLAGAGACVAAVPLALRLMGGMDFAGFDVRADADPGLRRLGRAAGGR